MSNYPDTPITREEQYLAAGLDGGDLPDPITREEQYLYEIATKMQGGGGSSVTVEPLTVTQNGTTTAPSGKAYSPVTTNVPNSYGAADEGKVVNNGALVAQTAHAPVTQNGTIDTTLYNSVPINVQGNPNYVETISGTLGNPWGNEFSRLLPLLRSPNDATVTMVVNAGGATTRRVYAYTESDQTEYVASAALGGSDLNVWEWALYEGDGTYIANGSSHETGSGRFATATLSESAVTALTIIHHPLPDSE